MQESDAYWMIFDEGQAKTRREELLIVGAHRLGPLEPALRDELANVNDLERLRRMFRRALEAVSWREILETP